MLQVTTTAYAGAYISENGSLKFFNHLEGYIEPDGSGGYDYVYQYKDHLGNIRLSYSDSNNDGIAAVSEILQEKNYYPFGFQHKGYNSQVNGTENKFLTYNGVELEESLNLNMYEMDLRQYDPAIARWIVQDPIVHFDYSPYQAFDNNPVFWADPSGANAVYNWDNKRYEDENGNEVTFGEAMASHGINNSSESAESPPTKFVNEKGETIADTNDNNYETYVITEDNEEAFVKDLKTNVETRDDLNAEKNKELGDKYGETIEDYKGVPPFEGNDVKALAFKVGYEKGYDPENAEDVILTQFQSGTGSAYGLGKGQGKAAATAGKMSKVNPKIKNLKASNHVKVNKASNRLNTYKYSEKPIPLIINNY